MESPPLNFKTFSMATQKAPEEGIHIGSQAVVIIHGIGEQRPMDTLRSFVDGIKFYLSKNDKSEENTVIHNKPDTASGNYETRRMLLSGSRSRPQTSFYEFYWAHNMRDTVFSNTAGWIFRLLFIRPKKIPKRLRGVWWTFWALILFAILSTLVIFSSQPLKAVFGSLAAIPLLVTITGLLQKYFSNVFLSTAGDAARYFTPIPSNIRERQEIRKQGLELLRKIHQRGYDRIVLVGHSLGSVIAYDLLRLLWTEYYDSFDKNPTVKQDALDGINAYCRNRENMTDVDGFQDLQYQFWEQQRATGNKWLITDLVTIGAAVCSANYFMVSKTPFDTLVKEREFPVCPPIVDERENHVSFRTETYDIAGGQKRSVHILHDAAPFAVTRWTNIYYSCDFVGAAGQPIFGKGIKDIEVKRRSLWFLPGGHTAYWERKSEKTLEAIAAALHLPRKRRKKEAVEAAAADPAS